MPGGTVEGRNSPNPVNNVRFLRNNPQCPATNSRVTDLQSTNERYLAVLQRNRRRIGAIARTYGGRQFDDLLQEILLQIWRSLPSLREESYVDTWCYRIALNTAISWMRSADRQKSISTDSVGTELIAGTADGHDTCELLHRFLETLSETDRAIVLMYLDDLGSSQMAEILGMTDGAVRVRIHRIKQKLSEWEAIQL